MRHAILPFLFLSFFWDATLWAQEGPAQQQLKIQYPNLYTLLLEEPPKLILISTFELFPVEEQQKILQAPDAYTLISGEQSDLDEALAQQRHARKQAKRTLYDTDPTLYEALRREFND